jgi:hypothetical protein
MPRYTARRRLARHRPDFAKLLRAIRTFAAEDIERRSWPSDPEPVAAKRRGR